MYRSPPSEAFAIAWWDIINKMSCTPSSGTNSALGAIISAVSAKSLVAFSLSCAPLGSLMGLYVLWSLVRFAVVSANDGLSPLARGYPTRSTEAKTNAAIA